MLLSTCGCFVGHRARAFCPTRGCPRRSGAKVVTNRAAGGDKSDGKPEESGGRGRQVPKGASFENVRRRKGRPAHLRNPEDSPLRDGNRDRLIGLLTERAVKTLLCYLMETNLNLYHWLQMFFKENPIPRNGNWEEVSGDAFLRKLLAMPVGPAKFDVGREAMYDCVVGCGVDPRNMAQRIMEIRSQLANEFKQDLSQVSEENSCLLRETLSSSLLMSTESYDDDSFDLDS